MVVLFHNSLWDIADLQLVNLISLFTCLQLRDGYNKFLNYLLLCYSPASMIVHAYHSKEQVNTSKMDSMEHVYRHSIV